MKIFICNRSSDNEKTEKVIKDILKESNNSVAILREVEHSSEWKIKVEKKMQEVDIILFMIGIDTFDSKQINWELLLSKQLNKRIYAIKLDTFPEEINNSSIDFQVFDNVSQFFKYASKVVEEDRQLLLEQYKIMVSSTEKVTDQRLKVNNLFFTITSSILSVAFVIGKTLNFSFGGIIGMIILTIMAFIVTFFWEKLVSSYGKLNRGKFKVISRIEKQLRTNMFNYEWRILQEVVNYEPNTKTEEKIIKRFRVFIYIVYLLEIVVIGYKIYITCY